MVSIFTGLGSGFERGSLAQLGSAGLLGSGALGRSGEQLSLNAATGNLLISQRDEFLVGLGRDASVSRTYNSLGDPTHDDNGDKWQQSTDRRIYGLTGTLNTTGSTVKRLSGDGSEITYTWNSTASAYVATDGAGAYDKLVQSGSGSTTAWTWTDGDTQIVETYSAYDPAHPSAPTNWRITGQADTSGNTLAFSYVTSSSRLDRITTQNGEYVAYVWDGSGNITDVVTHYGASAASTSTRTHYAYTSNKLTSVTVDLTPDDNSVTDGAKYVTTYGYDSSGRVSSITETDGSSMAIVYDSSGRVTSLTQTVGGGVTRVTSISYNTGYTTITDPLSQVTRLDYDSNNRLTKISVPAGASGGTAQVTQFGYDASDNVTDVTDLSYSPNKNIHYTYDASGNVLSVTDPLGNVVTRTYNAHNQILTETTTPAGVTSTTSGNLGPALLPNYTYWGGNETASAGTLTNGAAAYYYTGTSSGLTLQSVGVSVTAGDTITYELTLKAGTTSDAAAVDTSSGASSVTIVTGPGTVTNGTSGSWADISGLSTTAETRIRVTRTVTTSGLDYLYFIAGASTLSGSARAGLTIVVGDPSIVRTTPAAATIQPTTRYSYDSNDRLEYTISAEGRVTHHSYDASGNDTADQIYVGGHYDVSALANSAALTSTQIATWVSGLSDKTQFQNIARTYDARGNLSTETEYSSDLSTGAADTSGGGNKQTTYVYDQRGRLLSRTVNGLNTEHFVYDGLGRLVSSIDLNGATTSFAFNDSVTQTVVTHANGLVETSTYNKAGELLNTTDSLDTSTTSGNLGPNLSPNWVQWGGNQTGSAGTLTNGAAAYYYTGTSSGPTLQSQGIALSAGDTLTYELTVKASSTSSTFLLGADSDPAGDIYEIVTGPGTVGPTGGWVSVSGLSTTLETRIRVTHHATASETAYLYVGVTTGQTVIIGDPSIVRTTAVTPRFQYDAGGQLRIATDKTGNTSYFVYDHAGRKVADVDQYGDMTEYRYDANDRVVGTVRYATAVSSTNITTYLQNPAATFELATIRPTANANDLRTWKVFDDGGRIIEAIDGAGDVTTYGYDGFGRLVTTTTYANPLSSGQISTIITTSPTSLVLPAADAAHDSVSRIFYDKDGLVTGTLDGEGYVTKTDYDDAGQKITETTFAGRVASATTRASGTFADLLTAAGTSSTSDRVTHYAYNDQGQLRFVVDALGHITEYGYRSGAGVGSEIGDVRTVTRYANPPTSSPANYTVAGIQAVLNPSATGDDRISYAVYDAANRLTYAIDATGAVTSYSYDGLGQLIKTIQFAKLCAAPSVDLTTMTSWQADSTHLSSDDRVTRSYFDQRGRIKYTVDGEGFLTRYDYDAEDRVTGTTRWYTAVSVSDVTTTATLAEPTTGGSTSTSTTYDNGGRVATVTDGIGTGSTGVVTAYHYNPNGTLDWVKVAAGTSDEVQTRYTYDYAGRLWTRTDAYGATEARVTTYGYDGLGDLVSVADADGNTSYNYYNRLGQLTTSRDALGYVTELAYNAFGEAVSITRRANAATNAASATVLPVYTADASHDATSYSYYDKLGRVIVTRDAENYVTATHYTVFGEVDTITRWANKTASTPDVTTQPTVTADPTHDAVTSLTYDKLGRVKIITDPEIDPAVGGTTHSYEEYTYTAFGQKLTVRNKLGAITTNTYDHRGLLTQEVLPISAVRADGTTEASSVTNKFEYDARGNRTKMTEAYGLTEQRITTYKYDLLDRLIETHLPAVRNATDTADVSPVEYLTYDARGDVIEKKDASTARTLFYYDKLGRVTTSIGPTGTYSTISYALGAGANGGVQTSRTYDTQITLPTTAGGTPPIAPSGTYRETVSTFDKLGRLSKTEMANIRTGSWNTTTGVYATSVGTVTSSWLYDAFGNVIKSIDGTGAATYNYYDRAGHLIAQVDALNYLTLYYAKDGSGNPVYTRDAGGNVLFETRYATAITGSFDTSTSAAALKALRDSAATAAGDTGTKDRTTAFTYDRDGNRLTEKRINVGGWAFDPAATNGSLLALAPGTASDALIVYTYNAIGQVSTKTEATGDTTSYTYDSVGRLIVESRASFRDYTSTTGTTVTDTPTVHYYYDALGDLTRTTQESSTSSAIQLVTRYIYGAGGRLVEMDDPTAPTTVGATDPSRHLYYYDIMGRKVGEAYFRQGSAGGTPVEEGLSYQYDSAGNLTRQAFATVSGGTFTDAGDVTTMAYNAHGDMISRSLNGKLQEQNSYDNAGHLWKSNAGDGVWRYYIYDADGKRTMALEDEGYASNGLVNKSSLDDVISIARNGTANTIGGAYIDGVNATATAYDARGQATTIVQTKRQLSAAATTTSTTVDITSSRTYNAFGEMLTETDALNHVTSYSYNAMGRVLTVQHAAVAVGNDDGTVTALSANYKPTDTYYYDISGRLIGQKDANNHITTRRLVAGTGYGQATALVSREYHADGGIKAYEYDSAGNQMRATDEIGRATNNVYDGLGRLLTVTHANGMIDHYTYDVLGQRVTHWNSVLGYSNVEKTDYDVQGRVVSQIAFGGDTTTTSYVWDSTIVTTGMNGGTGYGGYLQTTTYQNTRTIKEKSDAFGHVISHTDMSDAGGRTNNITYDSAGRLIGRSLDNTSFSYLNIGLVSQVTVGVTGNPANSDLFDDLRSTYTYDKLGEKMTETSVHEKGEIVDIPYFDGGEWVDDYQYQSSAVTLENATATYDALGRLSSWDELGTAVSGSTSSLTPAASKTWSYDAVGNVRHVAATYHLLNGNGVAASSASSQDDWYLYDAMNRVTTSKGVLSGSAIVRGYQGTDLSYDAAGERMNATTTLNYSDEYANYDYAHREDYTYSADGTMATLRVGDGSYTYNSGSTALAASALGAPPTTGALKAAFLHDGMGRLSTQIDYLGDGSVYAGSGYDYFYNVPSSSIASYRHLTYDASGHVTNVLDIQRQGSDTIQTDTTNYFGSGSSYALGAVTSSDAVTFKNGSPQYTTHTVTTYGWYDSAVQQQVDYTPNTGEAVQHTYYSNSATGVFLSAQVYDGRNRSITATNDALGQVIKRDEADGVAWNSSAQTGGDPHEIWYRFNGRQVGYVGNNGTENTDYISSIGQRTQSPGTGAFRGGVGYASAYADFDQNYIASNTYSQGSAAGTYTVRAGDSLSSIAAQLWGDASLWYKLADANGLTSNSALIIGQTLVVPAGVSKSSNTASTFKPYNVNDAYGETSPTTPQPQAAEKKGGCGIFGKILLIVIAVAINYFAPGVGGIVGDALIGAGTDLLVQGIGVAIGVQDRVNWGEVAIAGVTAGLSSGSAPTNFVSRFVQAAEINAIAQGVSIGLGLQHNFDWAGVAAAGVGAAIGGEIGDHFTKTGAASAGAAFAQRVAAHAVTAIANAGVRSVINGTDFGDNLMAALPDVIGQSIGDFGIGLANGEFASRGKDTTNKSKDGSLGSANAPGNQAPGIASATTAVVVGVGQSIGSNTPVSASNQNAQVSSLPLATNMVAEGADNVLHAAIELDPDPDTLYVIGKRTSHNYNYSDFELYPALSASLRRITYQLPNYNGPDSVNPPVIPTWNAGPGPAPAPTTALGRWWRGGQMTQRASWSNLTDAFLHGDSSSIFYGPKVIGAAIGVLVDPPAHMIGDFLSPILPDGPIDYVAEQLRAQNNKSHPSIFDPNHVSSNAELRDIFGQGVLLAGGSEFSTTRAALGTSAAKGSAVEFAAGRQAFTADLSGVTGKAAIARNRAIGAVISEDLSDLRLTHTPEYSPFIGHGVAMEGTGTQIGKQVFSSRAELRNTIVHEELHHRWWSRGVYDHHPAGSALETKFYNTIERYERMRGW